MTLDDLADWLNPIVRGWMNYYGRFHRTGMIPLLQRVSTYQRRWAGKKYRRLRTHAAFQTVVDRTDRSTAWSVRPMEVGPQRIDGLTDEKSPVTGDCHAGICGSRGVQFPRLPDPPLATGTAGVKTKCYRIW